MSKYNLSIIIPSINPSNWEKLYQGLEKSVSRHKFEMIAVGPYFPTKEMESQANFRYIRDMGCPSRSFQIGAYIAEGEYLAFIPDDCVLDENAFSECLEFLKDKPAKDGMTLLYSEGPGYSGTQHTDPTYWVARTHADQQLKGIKEGWKIAPCFLYNSSFFRKLGGLDCRWEHVNLNASDFSFRLQNNGGTMWLSPNRVFRANWQPWSDTNPGPIQRAYQENDAPLFKKIYDCWDSRPIKIEYDNWRDAERIWSKRFKI